MSKKPPKKRKKKYNANRQRMVQAKLVAEMAVELEQIVMSVAQQQGKDGNLPMHAIHGIADWWVRTMRKEDPARNRIRVAARKAFLTVVKAKVDEMAKAERIKRMDEVKGINAIKAKV